MRKERPRSAHRRERNKGGSIHAWVIEEKVGGSWKEVRVHRGKDGPKAGKGQRVRQLRGKELRYGLSVGRKLPMSDAEIKDALGW